MLLVGYLSSRVKAPFPYWRYFKLEKDKKLDTAIQFLKQQSDVFIKKAEENMASGKSPSNILESMITARDEEGNSFSEDQLFPNIVTLLLAGEDTTANTLAWVLHYLSEQPEYQNKIYQELQNNVDENKTIELDDFPLLSAVAQETMRLMPVAPFLYLENNADENIEGYKIAKGTMIIALLSQNAHDPDIFEEPEKFYPERWLNMSTANRKTHIKDMMHFGSGPRQCPGMKLSFVEITHALTMLLKNFTLHASNEKTRDLFAFTVTPENLIMKISKR